MINDFIYDDYIYYCIYYLLRGMKNIWYVKYWFVDKKFLWEKFWLILNNFKNIMN